MIEIYATNDTSLISDKEIEDKIAYYEKRFGISSDEFLQQMETMEDSFETMDWMILLRHRQGYINDNSIGRMSQLQET